MTMFGSRWANAQVTNIDNNTLICVARLIIGATRKSRITSSLLITNLLFGMLDFTYTMPSGCWEYPRPTPLELAGTFAEFTSVGRRRTQGFKALFGNSRSGAVLVSHG